MWLRGKWLDDGDARCEDQTRCSPQGLPGRARTSSRVALAFPVLAVRRPGLRVLSRAALGARDLRRPCPPVSAVPGLWDGGARGAAGPFQNMQGNRLSCRDEEGRRGSDHRIPRLSEAPWEVP